MGPKETVMVLMDSVAISNLVMDSVPRLYKYQPS